MKISLIVPAYKASKFIKKAIFSAHHFDCVKEIIIIEDGSKDETLLICQELEKKYDKVKLYTHQNNQNKGAGASRNLGIKKAKNQWIAFLDADDVFLPNRFYKEIEYRKNNILFDGIYGALSVHYYSVNAEKKFQKVFNTNITTVKNVINPEKLKYLMLQMLKSNSGYFHLDTLTVKKELLIKVGLFNEKLRLHQDTDMIFKLCCLGTLIAGDIVNPVSSRGVHDNNRITSTSSNLKSRLLMYQEMEKWLLKNVKDENIKYKLSLDVLCYTFLCENKSYNIFEVVTFAYKNKGIFYNDKYFNKLIKNSTASNRVKNLVIRIKEKLVIIFLSKNRQEYSIMVS